jgi:hypothetical protein
MNLYQGLDSTIEDKIQLSILQGDFDNLQGSGQPRVLSYFLSTIIEIKNVD